MSNTASSIQTTTGEYIINDADRILVHEHVFNRYPYRDQIKMEEFVVGELNDLKRRGISVICDLTAYTKPYNYYKIIEQSPVKIVSCLGFYTPRYVPSQYRRASEEKLIQTYTRYIEKGIGTRNIRPGILKVAASGSALSDEEEKYFYVISVLSSKYGLPIALHAPQGALEHVRTLINFGATPSKIMVAHIETGISKRLIYDSSLFDALEILQMGAYIQLADFGTNPNSTKSKVAVSFFNDLYQEGYKRQLLLSGDSCWRKKSNQFVVKEYNHGNGKHYTYTTDFIMPLVVNRCEDERLILNENPRRFLCI